MCLPTLLSPGNIGGLPKSVDSTFLISTTSNDDEIIRQSLAFSALQQHVEIKFVIIAKPIAPDKYQMVSNLQSLAIQRSAELDTVFFIYPSFIFAHGTIANALQRLEQGHDDLCCLFLESSMKAFVQGLLTPRTRDTSRSNLKRS